MSANHYPRWLPCSVCGSLVFTTGSVTTCDECRQERYEEKLRLKQRQRLFHGIGDKDDIVVICDPTPIWEGGFDRLARFNRVEFKETLKKGYFSQGMIVTDRGERKVVKQHELILEV